MTKTTRNIVGGGLLAAGIAGLLLPVIPGIPFLIAAAAVLGADHALIRPWKSHFDRWTSRKPESKS